MRARIRVVPVCGWRRRAKFAAEVWKTLLRKVLHVPWGFQGGCGGLCTSGAGASLPRRVSCCYLAYRVLLCVARVGGFVCVNSRSCLVLAARYQILGGIGASAFSAVRVVFRYLADDGSWGVVGVALR